MPDILPVRVQDFMHSGEPGVPQIGDNHSLGIRPTSEGLKRNWHRFTAGGTDFLYDVLSGSLHVLDSEAGGLVDSIASNPENGRPAGLPGAGMTEASYEMARMLEEGTLTDPDTPDPEVGWTHERVVKALCLHISHDCDMRCAYCFAGQGGFGGQRKLMDAKVGKAGLDFLVKACGDVRHLEVDFFGGEPLMNMGAVKEVVSYGKELEAKHGKSINFTLTTNVLTMDDDTARFLNENAMATVLSMDGRPEVHDRVRRAGDGSITSGKVLQNMKRFVDSRNGENYYARGTYTALNLDFSNDVKFMADEGFDRISFEPVVLFDNTPMEIKEEHLPEIFAEYDRLVDFMLERRSKGKPILFFHFDMNVAKGPCLAKRLSGCGAGADYVAVTPEGDIYPCHQFVGKADFKLGDVWKGIDNVDCVKKFSDANIYTKRGCKDCWARFFCSGGCHANAFSSNGSILKPYKLACEITKKRLECALRLQADL